MPKRRCVTSLHRRNRIRVLRRESRSYVREEAFGVRGIDVHAAEDRNCPAGFAVPVEEAAAALRMIAERVHVIAEGAGALATAVALAGQAGAGKVVCVVSGGNIDPDTVADILRDGGT